MMWTPCSDPLAQGLPYQRTPHYPQDSKQITCLNPQDSKQITCLKRRIEQVALRNVQTNVNVAPRRAYSSSAISSRQSEAETAGVSSEGHLMPIQPAMLLSPPRQKDRRDFIKPPGYQQPTSARTGQGVAATGRFLGMGGDPTSANNARVPDAVPSSINAQHPHGSTGTGNQNARISTSMPSSMNNQTHHAPPNLLLNNFTGASEKQRQSAPSIISVGSSSTRYLSLPSEHGEANVIRNMLQTDVPPAGRVGPNGQDLPQHSQNINKVSFASFKDSSLDGTVIPDVETPTETPIDFSQKIASLSKQREEAEARLQQLKSDYGSKGGMGGMQRPATSGAEASTQIIPSRAGNQHTLSGISQLKNLI